MAHNGDSRVVTITVRVDKQVSKELNRYKDEWGIGPCQLGVACFYIGFKQIKQTEAKINRVIKTPLPAGLPLQMQNEKDEFFTPLTDLFNHDSIPTRLTKEIMDSLNQKAKEMEQQRKQEVKENE